MASIKFNKFAVTNGADKARVRYYAHNLRSTGEACVTLYAKDYGHALGAILAGEYENNTDMQTDYFERGLVRIRKGHPLYAAAYARAALNGCVE